MKKLFLLVLLLIPVATSAAIRVLTLTEEADPVAISNIIAASVDGDTILFTEGSFDWAGKPAVYVGKNVTILGAGAGKTVITAGAHFYCTATTSGQLLRISGMTLTSNGAADSLRMQGTAPIIVAGDGSLSGGIRVDHIIFNAVTGAPANKIIRFGGWLEGVMDHCIMDHNLSVNAGETLIVNHSTSPTGTGSNGNYSWTTPYTLGGIHQLFFEDNIFKRSPFVTDTNQYAGDGGARFTARHNTSWGSLGNGHGSRESGGLDVRGQRATETYKNMFVRASNQPSLTSRFTTIRSGEGIMWGNRYTEPSVSQFSANSPLTIYAYAASLRKGLNGVLNKFASPDGISPWDENEKSPTLVYNNFTHNAITIPTDTKQGATYAEGTGGTNAGFNVTINGVTKLTTTSVTLPWLTSPVGTNSWAGFVVNNLSISQTANDPSSFEFISGSTTSATSGTVLTVEPQPTSTGWSFAIGSSDQIVIRKVKTYFDVPGSGTGDPIDVTNPAWTNQASPGVWEWDNKYRIDAAGTGPFTNIAACFPSSPNDPFTASNVYGLISRNLHNDPHNGTSKPFYPYTFSTPAGSINGGVGGTELRPDTRVGADAEVWAMAPSGISSIPGTASVYEPGSGGFTYPHPLTGATSVPAPRITSGPTKTFPSGNTYTFQIMTANFSGQPMFAETGALPAGVTLDAATGLFTATAVARVPGTYPLTLTATYTPPTPDEVATQSFSLIVNTTNQLPTVAITAPSAGTIGKAPLTIDIVANPIDPDGQVVSVTFFSGSTPLGTVTSSPWTYRWSTGAGTFSLTAEATDNSGAQTTSAARVVTVSPATAATVPATIALNATSTPTPTPTATPTAKANPQGLYTLLPETNPNNTFYPNPLDKSVAALDAAHPSLSKPYIDGIRFRIHWDNIQPDSEAAIDWTQVDDAINAAALKGKKMGISIVGGIQTPNWVMGGVKFSDGTYTTSSNVIASPTANFTNADTGRLIASSEWKTGATIGSIIDSGHANVVYQTFDYAAPAGAISMKSGGGVFWILGRTTGAIPVLNGGGDKTGTGGSGNPVSIGPRRWSTYAATKAKAFIAKFGARYDNNPALSYVVFSIGPQSKAAELYACDDVKYLTPPATGIDTEEHRYDALLNGTNGVAPDPEGKTITGAQATTAKDAWLPVAEDIMQAWLTAFPKTAILVQFTKVYPSEGIVSTTSQEGLFEQWCHTAPRIGRIGYMAASLSDHTSPTNVNRNIYIIGHHNDSPAGYEVEWWFMDPKIPYPYPSQDCNNRPITIDPSVLLPTRQTLQPPCMQQTLNWGAIVGNTVINDGKDHGGRFIEIYEQDLDAGAVIMPDAVNAYGAARAKCIAIAGPRFQP